MTDGILTVNAGSSSLKYALFARDADLSVPLLAGLVEGLGEAAGAMTHEQALAQAVARVRGARGGVRVVAVGTASCTVARRSTGRP